MFFSFPKDAAAYDAEDQYLFGEDVLVAPVFSAGVSSRAVYLPAGETWREVATGKVYAGGCTVSAHAPIDVIPVFVRKDADVSL